MEMLGGGKHIANKCRKPEIVADAAYLAFLEPYSFTGNFLVDEDFLRSKGISDFEQYACSPGSDLIPDFFLDHDLDLKRNLGNSDGLSVAGTFVKIQNMLGEQAVKNVGASFAFVLTGSEPGNWYLDLKSGVGSAGKLESADQVSNFDVQMITTSENFVKMFNGELIPSVAFMSGEMKIKGNAFLAMKLESLMFKSIKKPVK